MALANHESEDKHIAQVQRVVAVLQKKGGPDLDRTTLYERAGVDGPSFFYCLKKSEKADPDLWRLYYELCGKEPKNMRQGADSGKKSKKNGGVETATIQVEQGSTSMMDVMKNVIDWLDTLETEELKKRAVKAAAMIVGVEVL